MIAKSGNKIGAKQIMQFLWDIEQELVPGNIVWNGIDVWPLIRIDLYHKLSLKALESNHQKDGLLLRLTRILRESDFFIRTDKTDYLFISDGTSLINTYTTIVDKYCDPLIAVISLKKNHWEKWSYVKSVKGNYLFKSAGIQFPILVKALADKFFFSIKKHKLKKGFGESNISILIEKINSFVGQDSFYEKNIFEEQLRRFLGKVDWFKKKLIKKKPKAVFIVDYYNFNNMALIKACKDLGINTIDLQHGVQSDLNAAYTKWINPPTNGYNTIPDYYFVWSSDEKKALESWTGNGKVINRLIGPFLISKKLIESSYMNIIENLLSGMSGNKAILFTMQYGIEYCDTFFSFIKQTQCHFKWLVRVHPVDYNRYGTTIVDTIFAKHEIKNAEIKISSELPLYALLPFVNLHITHSSATILEALDINIKSIILSEYGADFFSNQIAAGQAIQIAPQDLTTEKIISYCNDVSIVTLDQSIEKVKFNADHIWSLIKEVSSGS